MRGGKKFRQLRMPPPLTLALSPHAGRGDYWMNRISTACVSPHSRWSITS